MIQMGTILNVADNSGAKTVICIKVSKGFKNKYSGVGQVVLVSIKTLRSKRKSNTTIARGDICKALIIRTKVDNKNIYGETSLFLDNSVILLSKQNKFLFSRIFGLIPNKIRYTKYMRAVSLSAGVIK
jgi:large subunit ribosomal protein L14